MHPSSDAAVRHGCARLNVALHVVQCESLHKVEYARIGLETGVFGVEVVDLETLERGRSRERDVDLARLPAMSSVDLRTRTREISLSVDCHRRCEIGRRRKSTHDDLFERLSLALVDRRGVRELERELLPRDVVAVMLADWAERDDADVGELDVDVVLSQLRHDALHTVDDVGVSFRPFMNLVLKIKEQVMHVSDHLSRCKGGWYKKRTLSIMTCAPTFNRRLRTSCEFLKGK